MSIYQLLLALLSLKALVTVEFYSDFSFLVKIAIVGERYWRTET